QVEHPVTEMICGVDLVEAQLRIAAGEGLPWTQDAITTTGHAIECRVCCEDPARDFLPATGTARVLRLPHGAGVRFDGGLGEGQAVTASFDSMIGKLVCRGEDRRQAIDRAVTALGELTLLGVDHNIDYLARVVDHPAFRAGELHTGFVAEHADALGTPRLDADQRAAVVIAAALGVDDFRRLAWDIPEPYASIGAWRN
ncbi:MAG: biotin carboxylase, partial [Gammaproteobacteria bacterium]